MIVWLLFYIMTGHGPSWSSTVTQAPHEFKSLAECQRTEAELSKRTSEGHFVCISVTK